jgi:hypothetical protein
MQAVLPEIEGALAKNLTAAELGILITTADEDTAKLKQLKSQVAAQVASKAVTFNNILDFMKRVKSGAKSAFGDDSLEYERVGGKRISERKKKSRKVASTSDPK